MGRTGSALDNAAAESFNSTLEFELLRQSTSAPAARARRAVAACLDEYNTVRRHTTVGGSARSTTNRRPTRNVSANTDGGMKPRP